MAVSLAQYVDLLVKKLYGVAKTDDAANKSPSNESIPSPPLLRGDIVWTQSDQIANTAQVISGITQSYLGTSTVQCSPDTTTVPIGGVYPTWLTNLTDWIPQEFGSTWPVKVYVDTTGAANAQATGTQIFSPGIAGVGEFFFDTQAGLLNFIGETIPTTLTAGKSIFIAGYRYVGLLGTTNLPGNTTIGNLTIANTTITTNLANSNITLTPTGNGLVSINTTTGLLIPVGNTIQEPSPATEGTIRYNTDTPGVEVYTGNVWQAVGGATYNITSQTIGSADGSTSTFTLDQATDAERILVAINGLGQNPNINYTVAGDQITFSEAPQVSDIIEIRYISPTPSSGAVNSGVQYHMSYYATTGSAVSDTGANLTWNGTNLLTVRGAITATGNITGNYILGNGSQLTGIAGAYGNANVANYLPTFGGNLTAGNISASGNVTGNYILGNIVFANGIPATYGNANVANYLPTFSGNLTAGNVSVTGNVYGNNFIITVTETVTGNVTAGNILTGGLVSATGNITGNFILGNGSQLTGLPATYGNANVANYLPTFSGNLTAGNISASGNVTGNYILGNIANATGLPATYGNANVKAYAEAGWAGNIVPSANVTYTLGNSTNWWANAWFGANTIYVGGAALSQSNGNLSFNGNSVVTANASGTSITTGNVSIIGNITASYVLGNGSQLTGIVSSYSNANVANYLPTYSGNLTAGNVSTTGNIASNYFIGNGSQLSGLPATYSNSNVSTFMASFGSNTISSTGNITTTANIASGNISATGNVTGNYILGNGSQLTGLPATYGNSNVATFMAAFGSNTISTTGNITTTANISGGNVIIAGNSSTGVYALDVGVTAAFLANTVASFTANINNYTQLTLQNLNTGSDATSDYVITADNGNDTVNYSDFGIINSGYDNATPTNSLGNIVFAADTYVYAQGNISNTSQSGGNLAIGTTTAGKNVKIFAGGITNSAIVANISNTGVAVTGTISASGNIVTAGSFVGNGIGLTNLTYSTAGNIVGAQSNVGIVAGSYTWTFDNTGNTAFANGTVSITTLSAAGNVTGGNVLTGGIVSSTGNAIHGNILTVGQLSATGTITSFGGTNQTGFAVGNGAVSNVALGFFPIGNTPAEMAIRDYSTANSSMYFDTTIGSANTGGSFKFRGSNAFTAYATINSYGLNLPTRPAFRVWGNGSQSISSGNSIVNANVDYNQGSNYVNNTGTFTAPVAGLYSIFLNARAGTTASLSQIGVFKNGNSSGANVLCFWEITTSATQTTHFGVSTIAKLAVGDYIIAKCVSGTVTFDANDNWGAAYIG